MASFLDYLAYGSNLHPLRLRERVPSCQVRGVARLSGYDLRFHKLGRDGSGKCNIVPTGRADDYVVGVVYRLHAAQRVLLDEAEGLGQGYNEAWLRVETADSTTTAFTYVADPAFIDDALKPYTWYLELVLRGVLHHQAPPSYASWLQSLETIEDADAERHELHARLLAVMDK